MSEPRKNARNTRGKPFERGNMGRPKGARHRVTLAIEALLDGQHEALTQVAISRALDGDMVALRLCMDRIAPPRKDASVAMVLPTVRTAADVVVASAAVLKAVAAGEITPDEAGRIMALLSAHRAILEANDHECRIAALEAKGAR